MKITILMGSPRLNGNTAELCKYFIEENNALHGESKYIELEKHNIHSCKECYACQYVENEYGCAQKDDMIEIANHILWADLIVLATPIFSWYCTAKMKALLDRHYGFNKYYGSASGCLWEGKKVAIIATHGYDKEYATEPFETGIKRLCIHSKLNYVGMYSVQDEDDLASFQTEEVKNGIKEFVREIYKLNQQ